MNIIEPEDVVSRAGRIRLVDASWAFPGSFVPPRVIYEQKRIGNAVFFDIDEVAAAADGLPHMLPSAAEFEKAVSLCGISNADTVIVYDQTGIAFAAARAWWMFRVFGHDRVYVLNGGLPGWEAAGLSLNRGDPVPPVPGVFKASFRPALVRSLPDVAAASSVPGGVLVADARSPERFAGKAPEPRPGLRPGHVPGAVNLHYADLLESGSGRLRPFSELRKIITEKAGERAFSVDDVVAMCGSGVTACVLALGFHSAGRQDVAVYDGSWAEWGRNESGMPVEILE